MTEKNSRKWAFIVNPIAGSGAAKTIVPKMKEMIKKYNINAELAYTERIGHAAELSDLFFSRGFSHIIGVGGDGTLNEISRPLINKKDIIVGIVPAGTGNDFIQILGFPNRYGDKDWDTFFKSEVIEMDVGLCNEMIFLNGMGLGFDAQVAAENYIEPGKVKEENRNRYLWHIIKTILFFREKRMAVITGSGKQETDCFINTIANGRRFAGGFLLTPGAIANDGLLDVCMIKRLSVLERFRILLKVPEGKHITNVKVNYYQTPGINLEFTEMVPFHVDGELHFSKSFNVKIMQGALNTIYNPHGNHFFRRQ